MHCCLAPKKLENIQIEQQLANLTYSLFCIWEYTSVHAIFCKKLSRRFSSCTFDCSKKCKTLPAAATNLELCAKSTPSRKQARQDFPPTTHTPPKMCFTLYDSQRHHSPVELHFSFETFLSTKISYKQHLCMRLMIKRFWQNWECYSLSTYHDNIYRYTKSTSDSLFQNWTHKGHIIACTQILL